MAKAQNLTWWFVNSDLTPFIPMLIDLLNPIPLHLPELEVTFDSSTFVLSAETLEEILSKSVLSDGSGSKVLTEPLLLWCLRWGQIVFDLSLEGILVQPFICSYVFKMTGSTGSDLDVLRAFCKLLVAIGDHSVSYFASNIASQQLVAPTALWASPSTRTHDIQNYLRLLLTFTGLAGYYGIDEEESEMTLGFWYIFQEALWNDDSYREVPEEEEAGGHETSAEKEKKRQIVVRAVYSELVRVLRQKVIWPREEVLGGWTGGSYSLPSTLATSSNILPDQKDKFH
jgi:hypothetical protein